MIISLYDENGVFFKSIESSSTESVILQLKDNDKFVGGYYTNETHYVDENENVKELSEEEKEFVNNTPFGYKWVGRKGEFVKVADDKSIYDFNANEVRSIRNELLKSSDHILSVADFPLTDKEKKEISEYRQYLRDLTNEDEFPFNLDFKTPPHFDKFLNKDVCLNFLNEYENTKKKNKTLNLMLGKQT